MQAGAKLDRPVAAMPVLQLALLALPALAASLGPQLSYRLGCGPAPGYRTAWDAARRQRLAPRALLALPALAPRQALPGQHLS